MSNKYQQPNQPRRTERKAYSEPQSVVVRRKLRGPQVDATSVVPGANVVDLRSIVAKREAAQKLKMEEKQKGFFAFFTRKTIADTPEQSQKVEVAVRLAQPQEEAAVADEPVVEQRFAIEPEALTSESASYAEAMLLSMQEVEAEHRTPARLQSIIENGDVERDELVEEILEHEEREASGLESESIKDISFSRVAHFALQSAGYSQAQAEDVEETIEESIEISEENESRGFFLRPLNDDSDQDDKSVLPLFGFSYREVFQPLMVFMLFSVVAVLPASAYSSLTNATTFESRVTAQAEEAFRLLEEAGQHMQAFRFQEAEEDFNQSLELLDGAKAEISDLNTTLTTLAPYVPGKGKQFVAAQNLLVAGSELATAGEQLAEAMGILSSIDIQATVDSEDTGVTDILVVMHSALYPSADNIRNADEALQKVPLEAVPEDKRELVRVAQEYLPTVSVLLDDTVELSEMMLSFLGHDESKKYLLLFHNNYEIRPILGFIGTIGVLEVSKGDINQIEIPGGGVYDVAGQLTEQVLPPQPLMLVNNEWNLQDANWSPHYPSSAQKIQWFFEHSKQDPVDGVISLIPSVVEDLLAISGPVDMSEEFGVVIDQTNFYEVVQELAEQKYDETQESKKIIGELAPQLLENIFANTEEPQDLLELVSVLQGALAHKDLLVYANDPELQREFSARDWSGEIKETSGDYLGIFHANISGGKTDGVIDQTVDHVAHIQNDGTIVNTVRVKRIHKGDSESILEGVLNRDFVRFYVPEGSEIVSVDGFDTPHEDLFLEPEPGYSIDPDIAEQHMEIDEETGVYTMSDLGKTVFGGWIQTQAGETSIVEISYMLPIKLDLSELDGVEKYTLLVQKQTGSFDDFFTSNVVLPEGWDVAKGYPEEYQGTVEAKLLTDFFGGIVIERTQ